MTEDQRIALIPELEHLRFKAVALHEALDELIRTSHEDTPVFREIDTAWRAIHQCRTALRDASDDLKREGAGWIQASVTSWYRELHYDIRPRVEIAEEGITDPVFESVKYKGGDTWEVVMVTQTHGRERIIVNSDGATWQQVYSAEPLEAQ